MSIGKLWLAECETRHGAKCSEHGWAAATRKQSFLRLLDVRNLRIVTADNPETCRYVALSYVWAPRGLGQFIPRFPQTVLDAMEVVKKLGEQYLWVDALCILKERNSPDAREQIEMMDAVYGSAIFTIMAANEDNANAGLRGVRRQHFTKAGKPGLPRAVAQSSVALDKRIEVIAPLMTTQNLDSSVWNSRAWTFQERLPSRRLFSFADEEVVWHRTCMVAQEDMSAQDTRVPVPTIYKLNLKPQYFGIGPNPHYRDGSFEVTQHGSTHFVRSRTFAEYTRMISQYSSRNMEHDSDAVNSLAGLLRIFSSCFHSEGSYGLPESMMDAALLWRPAEPLFRRDGEFPTWSWAGWKGRVTYDNPICIPRDDSGQSMEVEGVRPLLRYFVRSKDLTFFIPFNGTGRGLPWPRREFPPEWASNPLVENRQQVLNLSKTPKLDDLDHRILPHLSRNLLLFWTSTSSAFKIGDLCPQAVDEIWASGIPPQRYSILSANSIYVGNILFDGIRNPALQPKRHELLLISEAQSSL